MRAVTAEHDPPAAPPPTSSNPVLDALLRAALDASGARSGWVVLAGSGGNHVAAAAAHDGVPSALGTRVPAGAPSGLAIATGQPAARTVDPNDGSAVGAGGARGVPRALLTVPIGDGLGAIELADPPGDEPFSIDDVEIVSLLADVAVAAVSAVTAAAAPPEPDDLATGLRRLRDLDTDRYRVVAAAVAALLGAG